MQNEATENPQVGKDTSSSYLNTGFFFYNALLTLTRLVLPFPTVL